MLDSLIPLVHLFLRYQESKLSHQLPEYVSEIHLCRSGVYFSLNSPSNESKSGHPEGRVAICAQAIAGEDGVADVPGF